MDRDRRAWIVDELEKQGGKEKSPQDRAGLESIIKETRKEIFDAFGVRETEGEAS